MKILYIDHYAGSPEHGMEYRPFYMAREWIRHGHEVTIVAASFAHVRSRQPACGAKPTLEFIEGVRYLWIPVPKYEGNGAGRLRNIAAFLYRSESLPRLLAGERFDAVLASSTYPFDNYLVHRLARRWQACHLYEVHDLWPLSPRELGGYSRFHPFIVATQIAEDAAYRRADAIVSLLPKAEGYMRSRGLAPGKFHYVPNGIVVADWAGGSQPLPELHEKEIIRLEKEGKLLVCYAGAHGIANALGSFVDAARLAPEAVFVLVGKGPERERLMARASGLSNVIFLEAVPKGAVPALLSRMDILFNGLQRQALYRFGISPNKLFDYMMAGKPIVCAIEAGNDMVGDAGCGITVEPENPEAIAAAVRKLTAMDDTERRDLGERGRRYVLEHHDYKVLAADFLAVIEEAARSRKETRRRRYDVYR